MDTNSYNQFLALHKPQLQLSGVPEHFWENLYNKLSQDIFDAGSAFSLFLIDYEDEGRSETDPVWTVCVSKEEGISATDPSEIYLIDHAWTFRVNDARAQLNSPYLGERLSAMMGVDVDDENRTEKLMKSLWRYCQSYMIQADGVSIEDKMPIWYVMDEVGSAINHSDNPNFRVIPFFYIENQTTYSLLFPILNCENGDQITRNFVENLNQNLKERDVLLLPWKYRNFSEEDFTQTEPEADYFLDGHITESLPDGSIDEPILDSNRPLKVFSEYKILTEHLTDPSFEIVENEEDADIFWLNKHFKEFNELSRKSPNKFINQFPFEHVITIKDLLSIICRRNLEKSYNENDLSTYPEWLPTTYNLKTELVKFVSYYQNREQRKYDNYWIIKPWNLARGLDTHITSDLNCIIRLSTTGPKIAQKYIENPVLFDRFDLGGKLVKFDIRYVILLKSAQPLEAYTYSNFFLRFANKSFSLDNFDDYEKHFTVMNYAEDYELRHICCSEFIEMWTKQYPEYEWTNVEERILEMLKEMLICATQKQPPCGIASCLQSRAVYAADIMLSWQDGRMIPQLLEVNWMPDCKRACDYYPEFYNDIFKLLFLNIHNEEMFKVLAK